jgi:hypothetical protein
MKRVLIRSVVALALLAGYLVGGRPLYARELPRAEDILDREARATGEKAAGGKLKTSVVEGKIAIQGLQGRFIDYRAAPDRYYQEVTIDGLLKAEGGFRGGVAWEKNSLTGARILRGGERAKAARDAELLRGGWRKNFKQARTVGEEKVEGRSAYKVELTTPEGDVVIAHYDKQSGLQVRLEFVVESPQGKERLVVLFSDHRKVNGIVHPFTARIQTGGAEAVMTVDRIEYNVAVPEERFALPADVQRLADSQKK